MLKHTLNSLTVNQGLNRGRERKKAKEKKRKKHPT